MVDMLICGRDVIDAEGDVSITWDIVDVDGLAMRVIGGYAKAGYLDIKRGPVWVCSGILLEAFKRC